MTSETANPTVPQPSASAQDAHFIYHEWDRRARGPDVPGLLELYTDDAVLETPLAPRILDQASGVLRGKDELARFFAEGGRRRPNDKVRWHRSGHYLWDGHTLSWEYRRDTPDGDQVDICEVMELHGPHIAAHRIYWGWFGTEMLIASATKVHRPS
jgi:hypothetical protein